MESIPEQRIQALPGAARKEAYLKIEALCYLRAHTNLAEDEIAEKVQFGSAEAMYQQLKTWELTGLLPPGKQEETPKPRVEKPGRKPRSSGPPEEVADPSAAAHLFDETVQGLARVVENLEHLALVYQEKRFSGAYGFTGSWVFLQRSYSEQGWKEVCERYGQDPNVESFHVDNLPSQHPLGASPYPPRDLVALIAAYALSDRPLEPLLEALQPGHTEEDIEEVKTLLNQTKREGDKDGLRRTAQQFAAAVYGHKVGRGSPVEELPRGHLLACYITARREVGIADEEIYQDIRSKGHELGKKEFNRLANLGLRFPGT